MRSLLTKLWKDESGQGMVEYGLIIALVAIAAIVGLEALSGGISKQFNAVATKLNPTAE